MTEKKKSIWRFGTREVVYAAIGAALYAVLGYATNMLQLPGAGNVAIRPAVVVPMFFGIAFGPIVGFITGFVGNVLSDLLSGWGFWFWWDLGNGLMGFIPGLIAAQIVDYRATKSMVMGVVFVVLAAIGGMGVASVSEMWVSGADINTVVFANFIPASMSNIINGVILLPILMVAYAAVSKRSGRT